MEPETNKPVPWYYFPQWEHNPNTMNVDALSIEEKRRLMKEGKCFQCKKLGHLAKDCLIKDNWDDRKRMIQRRNGKERSYISSSEISTRICRMKKKKNLWNRLKKQVFEAENWINISLSHTWYPLCNSSNNFSKYTMRFTFYCSQG